MLFGESVTKYVPIIIYGFLTISIWPFLYKSFISNDKAFSLVLSAFIVILIFINTPNIIQSFYWYGGTITYTMPFLFFNLFLSVLVYRDLKLFKNKPILRLIIAFLLMLIVGGFNEIFAVTLIVFFSFIVFLVLVITHANKKGIIPFLLAGISGLILSLLIMKLSPGVGVRSEIVDNAPSLIWIYDRTYVLTKEFFISFSNDKTFLYTFALIFTLAFLFAEKLRIVMKFKLKFFNSVLGIAVIIFAAVSSVASIFAVAFYSMAYHPPERALITATFMIIISVILCAIIINSYLLHSVRKHVFRLVRFLSFIVFLLSLLLLARDTNRSWRFIKNDLKTYADSWDSQKNSILKQSSQKDPVIIKNIPMVGRIDGLKDTKGWVAGCAAAYFGVNEFIVE